MTSFFKVLGLQRASENVDLTLYVIKNRDGSPRWLWNADNTSPDFLKFYAVGHLKSRLFKLIIQLIFKCRLQSLLFKKHQIKVSIDQNHSLSGYLSNNFALFTGTPGPNRKLILYTGKQFIKIALSATSLKLIENEKKQLQVSNGNYYKIPTIQFSQDQYLGLSDISAGGKRTDLFSLLHAQALVELVNNHSVTKTALKSTPLYATINADINQVQSSKVPQYLVQKLKKIGEELAGKDLVFSWSHRDFTPWNCYLNNNRIHLYDFELATSQLPFGFDAFHFVMQQSILVDQSSWAATKPKLKSAFELMTKVYGVELDFITYLKAYLVTNIAYYAKVYANQHHWHTQINWLFSFWNEGLSDLLAKDENNRKLIIGDVFDFLQHKTYAALKFPNENPLQLSEFSDIDFLMPKASSKSLLAYLKKHPLVKALKIQKHSFMYSLLIILKDQRVLAIDLIWKLKRKSLVFMNTEQALRSVTSTAFGVKTLDSANSKLYLENFYGLNSAEIPLKYQSYFALNETPKPKAYLLNKAKQLPENKGLLGFKNKLTYALDVISRLASQRGIIMTFSGVDGAGKSTVIAHTKQIITKKLRKDVVVIRHRPSLLPILSALTHGKAAAEQKAATTLPRQGKNKSFLSSLLRFSYYYLDYVFGQFYIYVNYVMRGKVVLYDRYYFDFINDSVRSNITLPKSWTKAGFKLLLKPHLNFFLYADPATILARKKELDAAAIQELTADYLSLFEELKSKKPTHYMSIENINLQDTLELITAQTQLKLF